jgi:hypothetical protein
MLGDVHFRMGRHDVSSAQAGPSSCEALPPLFAPLEGSLGFAWRGYRVTRLAASNRKYSGNHNRRE